MSGSTFTVGDPSLYARWGVEDAGERLRLLSTLLARSELVTLHAGSESTVVSRLLSIDRAQGTLDLEFNTDDGRRDAFSALAEGTALAELDRILLQFELRTPRLVGVGDQARLRAPLPLRLARLQRRDAFRVTVSAAQTVQLAVSVSGQIRPVPLIDLSVTGLSFEWDGPERLERGTHLAETRLQLPGQLPISCTLTLRSIEPLIDPFEDPLRRVQRIGCVIEGLSPEQARALQVHVTEMQQRMRGRRPPLGGLPG